MKRLLAAAALLALVLAGTASGRDHREAGTVSSTRLVEGGTVRITATVETPAQPGKALQGTFTVENVSTEPQKIELNGRTSLWLVIHAAHDKTYDTRVATNLIPSMGGPPVLPTGLQPGETVTRELPHDPVLWSGPLRVVPGWNGSRLPALRVRVSSPTPPVDDYTAITDVVAKTGHLLDNCRPVSSGVTVTGWISAPRNSAPLMRARCSVRLRHETGFDDAQVLVVSPPWDHHARVLSPYEILTWPKGRNAEAIGWQFIVTRSLAKSVGSATVEATRASHRTYLGWEWTPSGATWKALRNGCGGTVSSEGGGSEGPEVDFVSSCVR
jgi:hypothetical protein